MSTKIFPHKPRKLKPPKPPDPAIDRLFEADQGKRLAHLARRYEDRRIMSELRAEELNRRAAQMPPSTVRAYHCPECWARERSIDIVRSKNKVMWRMYRVVRLKREHLASDDWLRAQEVELAKELAKRARWEGIQITEDQIADAVVTCFKVVFTELIKFDEEKTKERKHARP